MKLALAISLVFGPFFALAASCATPRASPPSPSQRESQPPRARASDWLAAAGEAAQWLDHNSIDTEHGIGWRADPSSQDQVDRTLYAGSPGVVLFFLELAHATGDDDAMAMARAGAQDLLATLPDRVEGEAAGLYTGLAGVGYTLGEAWLATDDDLYRRGMERAFDVLSDRSHVEVTEFNNQTVKHGAASWSDCNDVISGTAGIGFAFRWARDHRKRPDDAALANCCSVGLVRAAQTSEVGLDWPMDASFPRRMPNFSHGTAGVAAFLSRASSTWGKKDAIEAARGGAEHLISIADRSNGGFMVGHDTPDNPTLMYMGCCHGPCGTARLFRELFVATHDGKWRDLELACAKSVMTCGLPEQRLPGFWNNVSRCCGDAGVIEFMLDLYAETKDAQYLEFAQRVGRDVLARATRDESGMRWVQAEHRVKPDLLVAQTGLMQGAAGIALALVHLDEAERGITPAIRLPDEPPRGDGVR